MSSLYHWLNYMAQISFTGKVAVQIIYLEVFLTKHCWVNNEEFLGCGFCLSRVLHHFWVTPEMDQTDWFLKPWIILSTQRRIPSAFWSLVFPYVKQEGWITYFLLMNDQLFLLACILFDKVMFLTILPFDDTPFSNKSKWPVGKLECVVLPWYIGFP